MNSFNKLIIEKSSSTALTWMIEKLADGKGFLANLSPTQKQALDNIHQQAIIFSVESSNRLEGVFTESSRLKPILQGKEKPQSRPEEELVGYKNALEFIFKNYSSMKIIDLDDIKLLHRLSQKGTSDSIRDDSGHWKERSNDIIEIRENGTREIRFTPVSPEDTPLFIEQLLLGYKDYQNQQQVSPVILIGLFIFDFLCIHPFRDGNGRVSRLLSLLLLCMGNYDVGRFISLEKIIENRKDEYYKALKESSIGWHTKEHDPLPWLLFFVSTLGEAYKDIIETTKEYESIRIKSKGNVGKKEMVRNIILNQDGKFTLKELIILCPSVAESTIKNALKSLKKENIIELIGRGRGSYWQKK